MKKIILALILLSAFNFGFSQVNIRVTMVSNSVGNNVDLDGFFTGDSDFCFEYRVTDAAEGNEVNNGPTKPTTNTGYTFRNGDNGPWTVNHNRLVFDHDFECPNRIPTQIDIEWRGLENDDATNYTLLLNDANTGFLNVNIPIGGGAPGTYNGTFTGSAGGQNYSITFQVVVTAITVQFVEDDICAAALVPVNGNTFTYAWCGNQTFEANEPFDTGEDIANRGSGWLKFTAPSGGTIDLSTDVGATQFGTEVYIYHAADGATCNNGFDLAGTQLKDKFDYLSYIDEADLGGFLNLGGQADIRFGGCGNILFSNALIGGATYYIQVSTDDNNEFGNIGFNIDNLGGASPASAYDVACGALSPPYGTTPISEANGDPFFAVSASCSYDSENELDNNPQAAAYDIDENIFGDDPTATSWIKFVAPCSGRMTVELNINLQGESYYLWKYDPRFGPGIPEDYNCWDLELVEYVDGGSLGGNTSLQTFDCLEPGYEYYVMLDRPQVATGDYRVWMFDPGPASGQPGNDVLCQALANPTYEIPVESFNGPTVGATPASYAGACFEEFAGEPFSNSSASNRANKTTWHYFFAPPSGSVDIIVSASNPVNWNVYKSFDGTLNGCYGGLANNSLTPCPTSGVAAGNGRTFTLDGTRNTAPIIPLISNVSNGAAEELCCLNPGDLYVIQVDGRDPANTNALYSIEINENEVFAGNTQVENSAGQNFNLLSLNPAVICFNDFIQMSTLNEVLPDCKDIGFVLHDSADPTPSQLITDSVELATVNLYAATYNSNDHFTNDGSTTAPFNTLIYASALADRATTWGTVCPSADLEDAVPVVFLNDIQITNVTVDGINCVPLQNNVFVSVDGGLPAYDNSSYTWTILFNGVALFNGTQAYGTTIDFFAPVQGFYDLEITDDQNCTRTLSVDATGVLCNDFCLLFNPINYSPTYPDFYTCNPITYGAAINLDITGGAPEFFPTEEYMVEQNVNGVITTYSTFDTVNLVVANGDIWSITVMDAFNCDTFVVSDTFNFSLMDCAHLCDENPLSTTNQPFGYSFNCLSNNITEISLVAMGGLPSLNNTSYYITVAGSTYPNQNVDTVVFSNGIQHSFYVNAGDNWTASITDSLGCGPYVLQDDLPTVFNFSPQGDSVSCGGDTLFGLLSGSQLNVDYRLFRNGVPTNIMLAGTGAPLVFGPILTDGEYFVQSYSSNNCPQDMNGSIDFLFSNGLDLSLALTTDVSCFGEDDGAIDISTTGGVPAYTYSWLDGTNTLIANTEDLNNIDAGTYSVFVSDNYGCEDSLILLTVSGPSASLSGSITTVDLLCNGVDTGMATINAVGGTPPYTYLWQNNDTTQTIGGLNPGIVSVTITDANNCSAYVLDTVQGPLAPLEITIVRVGNVFCFGGSNGEILISVAGGTAPYSILWSNGDTLASLDSLAADIYTVTVTDANGCATSQTITITEPSELQTSIAPTQPGCPGEQTGFAAIGVNGGVAPYSYEWNTSPAQFGIVATQLFGDQWYQVTVTDFNGCLKVDSVFVQNPDTMTIEVLPGSTSCIGGTDGFAYIEVTGGSVPYSYELNGVYQTDSAFNNLPANTYYAFVEDNQGCVADAQFTITPTTALGVTIFGTSLSDINATDDLIVVSDEPIELEAVLSNTNDTTQVVEYIWTPLANMDFTLCSFDTLCPNPNLTTTNSIQVVVEVIEIVNGVGCSTFDTLDITVRTDFPQFFPTAFSPFSDDFKTDCLNDYFEMNVAGAENLDVKVFNRWGELVFANPNQTNGPNNPDILDCSNPRGAWDGTFEGEPVPFGSYVYQVVATYFNGDQDTFSGTITVLR